MAGWNESITLHEGAERSEREGGRRDAKLKLVNYRREGNFLPALEYFKLLCS